MAGLSPFSTLALTRRGVLGFGAFYGVSCLLPAGRALAQGALDTDGFEAPRHGLSIFGDLKYGPDFPHFDYVNPNAPKGGEFSLQLSSTSGNQSFSTFNTLNIYTQKGEGAAGMGVIFDSLMAGSLDEADSLYGLVAKAVSRTPDGLRYRFLLRPEARFHDGTPLNAEDVVFSLETLKSAKAYATYRLLLRQVESAVALAPDMVEFRFSPGRSRELPLVVAGLPIFSKAYYAKQDFEAATLESPLGSGSYKVESVNPGQSIRFQRVAGYWGKDLPVARGQGNFDFLRYEYFRDREAAFQAFSAGAYRFREEFTSVIWATRYGFPAATDGRVQRATVPDSRPSGTQGWFINTRRPAFRDPRVREALALAFDFEWANKNLMYGLYKRTTSYFENSILKAEGPPSPEELTLLAPFKGAVPEEVFGAPFTPPVSDGTGQDRALLRRASELLHQAGAKKGADGVLRFTDGTKLSIEFLEYDNSLNRHTESFLKNLRLLGIEASLRVIDPSQFARRLQAFDFDIVMQRFGMSLTPGNELKLYFGSEAAKTPASRNMAGIANPAVDAMIETIIAAKTRAEVITAARVLDRLLRAGRTWIPAWYPGEHKYAYWDMFGQPGPFPALGGSASGMAMALWWQDGEKAKRLL